MSHPNEYIVIRIDRVHPTTKIGFDRYIIVHPDYDDEESIDGVEYTTGEDAEQVLNVMRDNWEPPQ